MSWDTVIIDTSVDSGIVRLDTVIGYRQMENVIVYVDAKTGSVATVDSNRYGGSGFWVTCGIHPTWYEGNQNVQAWTCTFCSAYTIKDSRNIQVWDHAGRDDEAKTRGFGVTWPKTTGGSAYYELEQSWNYFHDIHGYAGPSGGRNEQYLSINWTGVPDRADYQPFGPRDDYHISVDYSTTPNSAAQLDKIGHEYTHAMIHHGSKLDNYGDAAAIAEGLCDYFGYQIANHSYPARYASDWINGFGWQTGAYVRHFANPGTDLPFPSSSSYGDFNFLFGEKYRQAGVFRRFSSILTGYLPSIANDVWITMEWWMWSNIDYPGARDAFLAEYEYYYKKCSPQYRKVQLAWGLVGLPKYIFCKEAYIVSPDVSHMTSTTLSGPDGGRKPVLLVKPTDPTGTGGFPEGHEAVSFQWMIPSSWQVIYNEDHSQITIDTISDMASQMVTCIVTYVDSTKDTLTTFQHFVDGAVAGKSPKSNISLTDEGLKIFPNPAKNQLNVVLPTVPVGTVTLTLIDMTGREAYRCVLGNKTNLVNVPDLPAGVYVAKIKGEARDYVRRISIQ